MIPDSVYAILSRKSAHLRKEEEVQCALFADCLRRDIVSGNLVAIFYHIPNEGGRSPAYGAKLKHMGLIPGAPDFAIHWGGRSAFIEFKSVKGVLSRSQEGFRAWAALCHVPYEIVRSAEEGIGALKKWGAYGRKE